MQRWLWICALAALALACRAAASTPATAGPPTGSSPATGRVAPAVAVVLEVYRRAHLGDPPAGRGDDTVAAGEDTTPQPDRTAAAQDRALAKGGREDTERRATIGAGPSQPPRYDVTHAAFAERW